MARTRLYLVRHGEAAEGGTGLTELGREQARRVGRRLSGTTFGAIHHSVKPRAAETAAIIGDFRSGVPTHACEFVADRTPYPSDRRDYPELWRDWFDGVPASERDPDAQALTAAVRKFGVSCW